MQDANPYTFKDIYLIYVKFIMLKVQWIENWYMYV